MPEITYDACYCEECGGEFAEREFSLPDDVCLDCLREYHARRDEVRREMLADLEKARRCADHRRAGKPVAAPETGGWPYHLTYQKRGGRVKAMVLT